MIIQSCAETDEWVGISCPACCLPKMRSCLTSGVIIKTPSFPNICLPCQHDPFQSHMRSMNSPKKFHVLAPGFLDDGSGPGTRTACQQTVAKPYSSPVTSVKNSAYVVYWVREQSSMSRLETEVHRFDDVIQNRANIAWQASSMVEQAIESPA